MNGRILNHFYCTQGGWVTTCRVYRIGEGDYIRRNLVGWVGVTVSCRCHMIRLIRHQHSCNHLYYIYKVVLPALESVTLQCSSNAIQYNAVTLGCYNIFVFIDMYFYIELFNKFVGWPNNVKNELYWIGTNLLLHLLK